MEEILKCSSCEEKFETTGTKEPQVLPCQHTFCRACISTLIGQDSTKCPSCQEVHDSITSANRNAVRNNLTVLSLLKKNTTVNRRNAKLEFLKIHIVHVIMAIMICVVFVPNFNVMELRKPSNFLSFIIMPFYPAIILKRDMEDIPKNIILDLILWVNAIGIVTVLNGISPVIKQLVIRFLKAPVWKVGIMVICFAIVVQYFPSKTEI
uniref:uncharacterized protein LOC120335053 n=1 Tax=Styela clava TaxID=7725 RepID=UPI00193926C5|nr:uncharacterized protein LOC120335053 [Styela clava]